LIVDIQLIPDMNVLIVCNWGKNRSAHLASYLQKKGYEVKFGGINPECDNPVTQGMVDWGDILIFVQPQTKKGFLERLRVDEQKMITLDVEDRIEILVPNKKGLTGEEWVKIQQERVYPELEKQIEKYLPLL